MERSQIGEAGSRTGSGDQPLSQSRITFEDNRVKSGVVSPPGHGSDDDGILETSQVGRVEERDRKVHGGETDPWETVKNNGDYGTGGSNEARNAKKKNMNNLKHLPPTERKQEIWRRKFLGKPYLHRDNQVLKEKADYHGFPWQDDAMYAAAETTGNHVTHVVRD